MKLLMGLIQNLLKKYFCKLGCTRMVVIGIRQRWTSKILQLFYAGWVVVMEKNTSWLFFIPDGFSWYDTKDGVLNLK